MINQEPACVLVNSSKGATLWWDFLVQVLLVLLVLLICFTNFVCISCRIDVQLLSCYNFAQTLN